MSEAETAVNKMNKQLLCDLANIIFFLLKVKQPCFDKKLR